jgi:3-oxoacyl-[acyl-carrier protein] reductase
MNIDLRGKNALVCGSSQGIGKATAIELAELGANVTLLARNAATLEQVKDELSTQTNQHHHILLADFSVPGQVKAVVSQHNKFHILVNNTGGPPGGMAKDAGLEEFTTAFNNHLMNNQILVQAVIPFMQEEGYGRIINIISTSVKIPIKGLGVSNTIRGAVASWAKTLANELGSYGITVNNVLPGATSTSRLDSIIEVKSKKQDISVEQVEHQLLEEIPAGRFADPSEVASAVSFLASPAAAYINGINLPVDGGRTGAL